MTNYTVRDSMHPNSAPERYYKYTVLCVKIYNMSLLNDVTKMVSYDLPAVGIISFWHNNGIYLLKSYN